MDIPTTASTLAGKTALVTGGASRVGREICISLAERGVNVVVHYSKSPAEAKKLSHELRSKGVKAWSVAADFTNEKSVETLVEKASRIAGKIAILINNASLFTESTIDSVDWTDLSRNMRVNSLAPLVIGREFNKRCGAGGSIVNVIDSRVCGGDPIHVGYILSKKALLSLTAMMALEFAPRTTVNAVAPGLVSPPPGKGAVAMKKLSVNLPLKRHGEIRDVAQAVLFLLQSTFITGQTIYVDGGRAIRESMK